MTAYIPETLSMAPVFVYDLLGRRVAYSCRDIRAEMKRRPYRGGDYFVIAQPARMHEHKTQETSFETMTLRVREFRHGRTDHRELAGEFKDEADEQRYLHWYPELGPDWDEAA